MKKDGYPHWICDSCGQKYGNWYNKGTYTGPSSWYATFHVGTCEVCETTDVPVTEPRDYGGLKRPLKYLESKSKKNKKTAEES